MNGHSFFRIESGTSLDESKYGGGAVGVWWQLALFDPCDLLLEIEPLVRLPEGGELDEEHAERPDVALERVVAEGRLRVDVGRLRGVAVDGRDIARGGDAAQLDEALVGVAGVSVEHDAVGADVAVGRVLEVEVGEGLGDVGGVEDDLVRGERRGCLLAHQDVVVQGAPGIILI